MKKLFLFLVVCLWIHQPDYAQNPYWVFPPNYVNFKTGQVLPLPASSSFTKTRYDVWNGIFSPSGTHLFTLIYTLKYIESASSFGLKMSCQGCQVPNNSPITFNYAFFQDPLLIPHPNECNTYYGLAWNEDRLYLRKIYKNGDGYTMDNINFPYITSYTLRSKIAVAASPIKYNAVQKRHLDLFTLSELNGKSRLQKHVLNQESLQNNSLESVLLYEGPRTLSEQDLELSRNETYLAWSDITEGIYLFDLRLPSSATNPKKLSDSDDVRFSGGLEFSKQSNYLYFVRNDGSVGVYDIKNLTFSTVPNISLSRTQIELAIDGKIYGFSDVSHQLIGFDSENYTSGARTIYHVPNSSFLSTLVDQIDNADYDNLFVAKTCEPVVTLSSTLTESAYTASESITTTGTVTAPLQAKSTVQAGRYIELNPGFRTETSTTGGYFLATIGPCVDIAPPCSNSPQAAPPAAARTKAKAQPQIQPQEAVHIYPNPISTGNTLHFGRKVTHYTLRNSLGAIVAEGKDADQLPIRQWVKGMYLLELDNRVEKVIIQ